MTGRRPITGLDEFSARFGRIEQMSESTAKTMEEMSASLNTHLPMLAKVALQHDKLVDDHAKLAGTVAELERKHQDINLTVARGTVIPATVTSGFVAALIALLNYLGVKFPHGP